MNEHDRNPEDVHGKGTYHYERRAGYLSLAGEYSKEATFGTWINIQERKLDIRRWKGNEYLGGISLSENEVRALRRILDETDFGK